MIIAFFYLKSFALDYLYIEALKSFYDGLQKTIAKGSKEYA